MKPPDAEILQKVSQWLEFAAKVRGIVREALSRMGVTLPPEFRE
jgi:hypothetical protein